MTIQNRMRKGFTILEVIVAGVVVAILLSLVLPAIQAARMHARQASCVNNLKMIGLAMHNYHDVFGTLPPAWVSHTPYPQEKSSFGWQTMLLPFMEQGPLYDQLEFRVAYRKDAFRSAKNDPTFTVVKSYLCPDDSTGDFNTMRGGFATSNFSAVHGNLPLPRWSAAGSDFFWPGTTITPVTSNGLFCWNSSVRFRDVRDGLSNTMMVGERSLTSGAAIWPGVRSNSTETDQVTTCNVGNEINSGLDTFFSSSHPNGAQFVFGDGAVRFLNQNIESRIAKDNLLGTFQKLAQKDDAQPIGNF